jgi:CDP-diacylglycerol--glycerol-3-phosphate 3-phosphatidyltransferase
MVSIANILSIIRIILVIPVVYFLNRDLPNDYLIVVGLILCAVLTDYFDGYFARKFNQISITGKILDPVADKIFVGAVVIFLVLKRDFPLWYTFLIISKDIIICIFGSLIIKKRKLVLQSNIFGKITNNAIVSSTAVYIIDWDFMKLPLVYLGTFFIVLTLISYGNIFLKVQKGIVTKEKGKI